MDRTPSLLKTLLAFLLIAASSYSFSSEANKPREVKVGMYITKIYDINFAKNQYNVEFWGWFLHEDDNYKPLKRTEIINAKKFSLSNTNESKETATHWDSGVFKVHVNQQWDVRLFPFDTQKLTIQLEDALETSDVMKFIPDVEGSSIAENTIPDGWTLKDFDIKVSDHSYPTTFGDPKVAKGAKYDFHRVTATITLQRSGLRIFSTTFLGFFAATILICIVFSINISKHAHASIPLQPRITLCVGSLFSAVGGIYGLAAQLPYTTDFTLSDSIQITTFTGIALAILTSVLADIFAKTDYRNIVANLTRGIFGLFIFAQLGINSYLLVTASSVS